MNMIYEQIPNKLVTIQLIKNFKPRRRRDANEVKSE